MMLDLRDLDIGAAIEFSFIWETDHSGTHKVVSPYPLERYLVKNKFIAHVSNDLSGGPVRVDDLTITVLKIAKDLGHRIMKTPHSYFSI